MGCFIFIKKNSGDLALIRRWVLHLHLFAPADFWSMAGPRHTRVPTG